MMSPKIFTLLFGLASTGSSICFLAERPKTPSLKVPSASSSAFHPAWQAADFLGVSLGTGTVVSIHSYDLSAHAKGRIEQVFFQTGQHLHKGDVLAKFYGSSFVFAPADGIATERLVAVGQYLQRGALIARFTELHRLRLRLLESSATAALLPGQFIQIQSEQRPDQGVTAAVVSRRVEGRFLLVDLRLRTASTEPLPLGAPVQAHALLLAP